MELQPIKKEDLIFLNTLYDDQTHTYLNLVDCQWMNYKLETTFRTEDLGELGIVFLYYGCTESEMEVDQHISNTTIHHSYRYPTNIFKKHICRYMQAHIDSWNEKYAFDGEQYVLDFYNEVINYCKESENKI